MEAKICPSISSLGQCHEGHMLPCRCSTLKKRCIWILNCESICVCVCVCRHKLASCNLVLLSTRIKISDIDSSNLWWPKWRHKIQSLPCILWSLAHRGTSALLRTWLHGDPPLQQSTMHLPRRVICSLSIFIYLFKKTSNLWIRCLRPFCIEQVNGCYTCGKKTNMRNKHKVHKSLTEKFLPIFLLIISKNRIQICFYFFVFKWNYGVFIAKECYNRLLSWYSHPSIFQLIGFFNCIHNHSL